MIARTRQHRQLAHWFARIRTISVEHFDSRADALAAEKNAIKREHPMFNLTFLLPADAPTLVRLGKLKLPRFRTKGRAYYYDAGGKPRRWIALGTAIVPALDAYEKLIRGFYKPRAPSTENAAQVLDL